MARNKFFLSYRRSDTKQVTGHLFEQLRAYFGRDTIFLDVDGIRAGVDFREVIIKRLSQCAALLIIINPTWVHAFTQRVQDNAPDFVLFEIETALEQHIPVIPVLVDGATMPTASQLPPSIRKLAEIQAIAIADHPLFNETLHQLQRQARGYLPPYWRVPQRVRRFSFIALTLLVVFSAVSFTFYQHHPAASSASQYPGFTYHYQAPTHHGGQVTIGFAPSSFPSTFSPFATPNEVTTAIWDSCLVQLPDLSLGDQGYRLDQCAKFPDVSADQLTITLHIQPGLTWADGEPLTADDFAFAYKLASDTDFLGTVLPESLIANAQVVDPVTVHLILKQPYAAYRFLLSSLPPLPLHMFPGIYTPQTGAFNADAAAQTFLQKSVFTKVFPAVNGPFMVNQYTPKTSVTLTPNPRFASNFFHKPSLDRVILTDAPNDDALIQKFNNDTYDIAEGINAPDDRVQLLDIPQNEQIVSPQLDIEYLLFNEQSVAPNALHNHNTSIFSGISGKLVRQALIEAFDRCSAIQAIIGRDCNDPTIKTNEYSAPPSFDFDPNQPFPAYQPLNASTLLDAAGYKLVNGKRVNADGTPLTIDLTITNNYPHREALAALLKQQWENALGITCIIQEVAEGQYFGDILPNGNYDVGIETDINPADPSIPLSFVIQSQIPSAANPYGLNHMGINDPLIEHLYSTGLTEFNEQRRIATYRSLQQYLSTNLYLEPLFAVPNITLAKKVPGNYLHSAAEVPNDWNIADWFLTQ